MPDPSRASTRTSQSSAAHHTNSRHGRPRVTLFSVPFKSRMTDEDIERLRRSLDLVTYVTDTPGVSGASPGWCRSIPGLGLFLERGAGQDEWVLEGRTWDEPARIRCPRVARPGGDFVIERTKSANHTVHRRDDLRSCALPGGCS